jgi:hypothetical protein
MRVPGIVSGVNAIQEDQKSERQHMLLEWISPTNYPTRHSDILKHRQEGTGQWFLDSPEVARWLSKDKETLFCPGVPGAGKTMMAAITIHSLLQSMQHSSNGIAYVYCNYKAEEQDAFSMLSAILKQLAHGHESAMDIVEALYAPHATHGTKPLPEEILDTLGKVVKCYPTVYLVIDALDECQDIRGVCRDFLSSIRSLQVENDVRLMATSRSLPAINQEFCNNPTLEIQANRRDVERFIAGQVYRMPRCIQKNPALQRVVQDEVAGAADGM